MGHPAANPGVPAPIVQVPRPLSGFIGRARERAALSAMLTAPGIRLLTIAGPGGVGKTRLALETAASLSDAFPDGMVLIPLAPTNDPERVPMVLADSLSLEPVVGFSLAECLDLALRDKRLLLVFDNMEHLLPAGSLLVQLLADHPLLTILVTSRTRLGLSGEHVFPLEPLAPADARALFARRAAALQAGRAIPFDIQTIDAICARLDHLPLAIELAAARTATLPPESLLQRLSLSLLRDGPRDVPLRHQTMRDTIAWSYDLLDHAHRAGFRRLAVFTGGFTLEAAEAVLGPSADALELIDFLVARSLVVPMAGEPGVPRFTMLESIRQFGVESLAASGDDHEVRRAHADWLIRMAEHAIPLYDGPQLSATMKTVGMEIDNLRAAIGWCLEQGDGERSCRLTGAIWRIWGNSESKWISVRLIDDVRREGLDWTTQAVAISEGVPFAQVVEAMSGLGLLMDTATQKDAKRRMMADLLSRSTREGLPHGAYWAHFALADIARDDQDWDAAHRHCEAAIALAPDIRDADNQRCGAELHYANMLVAQGRPSEAEPHLLIALEHGERAGNPHHLALVTIVFARVCQRLDRPRDAVAHLLRALDYLEALDDIARTRVPMIILADLARAHGHPAEAVRFLSHADAVPRYINSVTIDEAFIAPYRASLSPSQFTAEWETGRQTSPADMQSFARAFAVTLALGESAPERGRPRISAREADVIHLLVEGMTNRGIGQALFISERTVEKHILHIMTKLDVESRTGIVAWAVRNQFTS